MQGLTNEKKELTSDFSSCPSWFSICIFISFHSFIHASVRHFPPFFPQSAHSLISSIHAFIRHLQALFVRRFFSCQLRSRWKVTRLTPDPSFMSCSRLIHKLLNLTTVHAVNPTATHAVCFVFCFFLHLHWKVLTLLSLIRDLHRLCITLTGWLTLQHHDLTPHLHA